MTGVCGSLLGAMKVAGVICFLVGTGMFVLGSEAC